MAFLPASTNYSVVQGFNNSLDKASYSVILGNNNTVAGFNGVIIGNNVTSTDNDKCVIINPYSLTINNAQTGLVVIGGYGNTVDGISPRAVVIGGSSNQMNGTLNVLIAGYGNIIDDANSLYCAIIGGQANLISGTLEGAFIGGGKNNRVTANNASAFGERAAATRAGQQALSSVEFLDETGSAGKADHGMHRLTSYLKTTDDTPTEVQTFTLEDGVAYDLLITVVGNQDGGGNRAAYRRRAVVYRDGTGSATLQGSVDTIGTDQESNAAWDLAVTVSGNDLLVTVTGVAATDINWTCSLDWTAVGEVVN